MIKKDNEKMLRKISSALLLFVLLLTAGCGLSSSGTKYLGEPYTSTNGGYTLRTVKDYTFKETFGIMQMVAPDGDTDKGPAMLVLGTITDEDYDDTTLLEQFFDESSDMVFDKTKSFMVNGVKGTLAEISSVDYEFEMAGKVFLANPYPNQPFILIGFSTVDEWKAFEPIVDAVIQSVEFFEAQAITP